MATNDLGAGSGSDDDFDLFAASLGGSLMKDLLADLAVDDQDCSEWLNLEQLENELNHLDTKTNMSGSAIAPPPASAAGFVVQSHVAAQQAFGTSLAPSLPPPGLMMMPNVQQQEESAMDAWSLSLQKFTASSSLTNDFLQADSARKQNAPISPMGLLAPVTSTTTTAPTTATATAVSGDAPVANPIATMGDYDVTEKPVMKLSPPPGLTPDANQQLIRQAADQLTRELVEGKTAPRDPKKGSVSQTPTKTHPTPPRPAPMTPQNSVGGIVLNSKVTPGRGSLTAAPTPQATPVTEKHIQGDAMNASLMPAMPVMPPVPEAPAPEVPPPSAPEAAPQQQVQQQQQKVPPQPPVVLQQAGNQQARQRQQPVPQQMQHPQMGMQQQPPPGHMMQQHPHHMPPMMAVPVAVPIRQAQAWQSPPPVQHQPPPQAPRVVVFANPHPSAAPIPAKDLAGKHMTPRDISYVVHGMLRPILAAETSGSMSTYHLNYWTRHHPVKPPPSNKQKDATRDALAREFDSRRKKAAQWSEQNKVLGATNKTNVARPRALISTTAVAAEPQHSGKQRAALWKARILCDQAHCCLAAILDQQSGPQNIIKLSKCLGVSVVHDESTMEEDADVENHAPGKYNVDLNVLQLLLKLPKGKNLLARVLERALLPPAVAQALLAPALVVLTTATSSGADTTKSPPSRDDDRLFGAWTIVVSTLPELSGDSIVAALQTMPNNLTSTPRMQCTHALLSRGGALAASSPGDFGVQWSAVETEFLASAGL